MKNNGKIISAFIIAIIICVVAAAGCDSTSSAADDPVDRCDAVARKAAKRFRIGNGVDLAQRYEETLRLCTARPGMKLTEAGLEYMECIEAADHGADIISCEYKLDERLKQDKLKELRETATPVMQEICDGESVDEDDPRMEKATRLENEARTLGATDDEVDAVIAKVKVDANCK